jgi:hypothetical protein
MFFNTPRVSKTDRPFESIVHVFEREREREIESDR